MLFKKHPNLTKICRWLLPPYARFVDGVDEDGNWEDERSSIRKKEETIGNPWWRLEGINDVLRLHISEASGRKEVAEIER